MVRQIKEEKMFRKIRPNNLDKINRLQVMKTYPIGAMGKRDVRINRLINKLYNRNVLEQTSITKEEKMAVDFEALDLVRTQNRARSYNKRVGELAQQVTDLQELAAQMVKELPETKKWSFEERLKKIKNTS